MKHGLLKVSYEDHMGSDLKVVNMARVSFGRRKLSLSPEDERLIEFLARGCPAAEWRSQLEMIASLGHGYEEPGIGHTRDEYLADLEQAVLALRRMPTHWAPFAHCQVTVHVSAPIAVARQLVKHQIGGVWSEESRRYVGDGFEFYFPEAWRSQPDNVKQGSGCRARDDIQARAGLALGEAYAKADEVYATLTQRLNVAREQARFAQPVGAMTQWYWTGSLIFFSRVCRQRLDPHAQAETREVARQIDRIIAPLYPVSWAALSKY